MSKQEVLSVIDAMPDEVSFEDIMYELYVMSNIKARLDDCANGCVRSHEDVRKLFS